MPDGRCVSIFIHCNLILQNPNSHNYRDDADAWDKSNQAFANIILDQTVLQDTEHNARGTISNDYADSLVKSNPNRFQYVPTQDYLKGIDY